MSDRTLLSAGKKSISVIKGALCSCGVESVIRRERSSLTDFFIKQTLLTLFSSESSWFGEDNYSWVFVLSPHEFEILLPELHSGPFNDEGVRWMSDVAACCVIPRSARRARSRLRYRAVTSVYWLKNQAPSEQSRWEPHRTRTNTTGWRMDIFFFFFCSPPHWSKAFYYNLVLTHNWPFARPCPFSLL